MPQITQDERPLRATTPLGDNVLVPVSLTGTEGVSRPFLFTVDFVSEDSAIAAADLLGKGITLHVERASGEFRLIHGLVRSFASLGTSHYVSRYRAEIVPALWFLSLSNDCRTFEDKKLTEIVEKVCKDAGVTDVKLRVASPGSPIPYVAQYRESNLQFVTRLLEEAGLYFAFEHEQTKHTLVISDSVAGSIPAMSGGPVKVDANFEGGSPQADTVFRYSREYAVHAASIALADHDLHRPNSEGDASSGDSGARGQRFDFLGDLGPNRSPAEAKLLIESEERLRDVVKGQSSCAGFGSGMRVKLQEGPLGNAGEEFLLLEVTHKMDVGDVYAGSGLTTSYENEFLAIPAATHFRPARVAPRPSVQGTQTAKVVGSGGAGNIDVDDKGRVLLEFPWDRGVGLGGKSKHRVYVASIWAGEAWGFVQLPRVGQEVLVEYLEGDVNRPMITGRVYNSTHAVPYALPANKTQSGWKSRTLEGGSDNFNELRFDDKKGSEHISMQAEKDLKILVKNDETREVQHDRTTTVKNHDKRTVTDGDDTHTVSKGKQTNTIKGNQATTINDGNRTVTIEKGNDTLAVKMGNVSIKADAGSISIEAMQKIELKVGSNTIVIDMMGITMKGMNVKSEAKIAAEMKGLMTKVEGSAMCDVKAPMTNVKGDAMLMLKGGITMIN